MKICEICGDEINTRVSSAELTEESSAGATEDPDEIVLHLCENCREMRRT